MKSRLKLRKNVVPPSHVAVEYFPTCSGGKLGKLQFWNWVETLVDISAVLVCLNFSIFGDSVSEHAWCNDIFFRLSSLRSFDRVVRHHVWTFHHLLRSVHPVLVHMLVSTSLQSLQVWLSPWCSLRVLFYSELWQIVIYTQCITFSIFCVK